MVTTADVKFNIADISSVLTTTPPIKASVSSITASSINESTITDEDKFIDINEFTTDVHRETGIDDIFVVVGSGLFDTLMQTATEHLAVQYANGRIRGEDYSSAYIQVFQTVLQAAITIWLQKGITEKQLALELAKINVQNKIQVDTLNVQNKVQIAIANVQNKLQADTTNTQLAHQTSTTNAQLKLQADTSNAQLKLQADTLKSQGDLQWAIVLLQRDTQEALIDAQVQAEEAKKNLYRRQIEGFDEDYKQKILKICMDSWAVGFSVARDSFEASGIPAPMQKVTIDSLYNQYIVTELDKYDYGRPILDNP